MVDHLFVHCTFSLLIWDYIFSVIRIEKSWIMDSVVDYFQAWIKENYQYKALAVFVCWGIWKCRNALIFYDEYPLLTVSCLRIINYFKEFWQGQKVVKIRIDTPFSSSSYLVGFFDGAA